MLISATLYRTHRFLPAAFHPATTRMEWRSATYQCQQLLSTPLPALPAGRRPIHAGAGGSRSDADTWAAQVRPRLPDAAFNALRGQQASQSTHGWPDNRVLELDGTRAAYDAWGNLTERIEPDGAKLELTWDGADRLIALWHRDGGGQHA